MFPSKADIKFFYDMGIYNDRDVEVYVAFGYITEADAAEIVGDANNGTE